jgi:hypothetical protein
VTAVYSVSRLRHRWHFARATLVIAVVTIAAILAWDLARSMTFSTLLRDVMWGGLSSFLSVSLAFLLLPPVEHLFGLTSDITLLELSDLNRPPQAQLEVPGAYPTAVVGAGRGGRRALGASSLLARVSAYYRHRRASSQSTSPRASRSSRSNQRSWRDMSAGVKSHPQGMGGRAATLRPECRTPSPSTTERW